MSQHPSTNRANPDQTQENLGGVEEIEEGYETPTSEEHKIPPVRLSFPPPAPKKRKRLFVERRISVGKVVFVEEMELESFFDLLESQSRPPSPPPQVPEPDQGTSPKKIRSDK